MDSEGWAWCGLRKRRLRSFFLRGPRESFCVKEKDFARKINGLMGLSLDLLVQKPRGSRGVGILAQWHVRMAG